MRMTAAQKQMVISRAARGWLQMAERTLERDDLSVPCDPKDQMTEDFIYGTAEELGFEPTRSAVAEMRRKAVKYSFDGMRAAAGEANKHFERLWSFQKGRELMFKAKKMRENAATNAATNSRNARVERMMIGRADALEVKARQLMYP